MNESNQIPIYSLHNFSSPERKSQQFQVEVFDAKRHFQVKYPHRHDFFEVLFLQKGTGFHVIDSNKYEIQPPCFFLLSPGQAHKLELSHDIEGFIFIFTAEFYLLNRNNQNRLIEFPFFYTIQQNNPPLILNLKEDELFLKELFLKGINEAEDKENGSIEMLRSILDLILTYCAKLYPADDGLMTKGKGHLMVKRFYQMVEENYLGNVSV
nr:AraC family ligand binding domain-containing protein [Prolixibacteraceae bacterium]